MTDKTLARVGKSCFKSASECNGPANFAAISLHMSDAKGWSSAGTPPLCINTDEWTLAVNFSKADLLLMSSLPLDRSMSSISAWSEKKWKRVDQRRTSEPSSKVAHAGVRAFASSLLYACIYPGHSLVPLDKHVERDT